MSGAFVIESYCDDLGPEKVLHIHEAESGLHAIVVVDNTACGPSIGGVRMAADVSMEEVFRLQPLNRCRLGHCLLHTRARQARPWWRRSRPGGVLRSRRRHDECGRLS